MLELLLYKTNLDLIENVASKNVEFVICPSPKIADSVRGLFPKHNVVTISKWISDLLKKKDIKKIKKADLQVKLASVWRLYYPQEPTSTFFLAFELFTELRAFSLNLELLSDILHEYEETMVKSVFLFWTYLTNEKLVDEQLSYQVVSEEVINQSILLIGFKHLNGIQIDLFKKLGEAADVYVSVPEKIYQEGYDNDWFYWIKSKENVKTESVQKLDRTKKISTIIFPQGKGNDVLKYFYSTYKNHELIIASEGLNIGQLQEVRQSNSFYKAPVDLFKHEISKFITIAKNNIEKNPEFKIDNFIKFCDEYIKKSCETGSYLQAKIGQLTIQVSLLYKELNELCDKFFIEILANTLTLNVPRIFLMSLTNKCNNQIFDINDLSFRNSEKSLAIFVNKTTGLGFSEKKITEKISKMLKALGPVKRRGLDFLYCKNDLVQSLGQTESILIIENGIIEHDFTWTDILSQFDQVELRLVENFDKKLVVNLLSDRKITLPMESSKLSATKIQSYLDCPQKFYFQHVDRINNRPEIRHFLAADELGVLEHKIIECYFQKINVLTDSLNYELHEELSKKTLTHYLESKNVVLSEMMKVRALSEILNYSLNGIEFITEYCVGRDVSKLKFEQKITEHKIVNSGSIDCIIEFLDGSVSIFDFKRSSSSIGSKKETLIFNKIQIWIYLHEVRGLYSRIRDFGYLNLKDPNEKTVFFEGDEASKILEECFDNSKIKINSIVSEMKSDCHYLPRPINDKVCVFCPVSMFCTKGILNA